jgi:hypothetical protein
MIENKSQGTNNRLVLSESNGLLFNSLFGDDLEVNGVADMDVTLGGRHERVVNASLSLVQAHSLF